MLRTRLFFIITILIINLNISASSVLELMGSTDSPNPFTARIIATGAEAAYFNPAYLVLQEDSFKLGFGMMLQNKDIEHFKRPDGYDVSTQISNTSASVISTGGKYVPLATSELMDKRGSADYDSFDGIITIGAVKSIIKNWLAVGAYALIPTTGIQTQEPFFNDEREQYFSNSLHFELYGDRLNQFSMAFALGGKISNFLRLGAGVAVTTYTVTRNQVFVPDSSNPSQQLINAQMKVGGSAAPFFSFVANPFLGFNLTGTIHFPTNTGVVELNNEMQVNGWEYEEGENPYLEAKSSMTAGYQPMKLSLGLYYDFNVAGYKLTPLASFAWARWSTYVNRHGETPQDEWKDTFSFAGGFMLRHRERKAAFNINYVPSPVPAQTGRENYIDNNRLGFSVGYSEYFHFEKFSIGGGITSSIQILLERIQEKDPDRLEKDGGLVDEFPDDSINFGSDEDEFNNAKKDLQTNNPGFPGWKSSGFVFGIGISAEVLY